MTIEWTYLAKHPQHIKQLAEWYFDEWGEYVEDGSIESFQNKLQDYLNMDRVPLIILAVEGQTLVGAVQIKYREMTIYPEKEYWLGGVYVNPDYRGQHIASQLVLQAEKCAIELKINLLYLQTESLNGGLYAKLGWEIETQVNYRDVDVAVMHKVLNQER
ncbi:GNAT family N-acetyltransferase [Pseudoalteromonas phenolica]|uniref:GNAT family N-acetyltransferase n=1 Tax=Pseudoalteromonas phenolica TaxID=161398 RepID=UPI0020161511|nr:GNAT family N-acetyltransferase [Pseudoalteromonas phenolica]